MQAESTLSSAVAECVYAFSLVSDQSCPLAAGAKPVGV